MSHVEPQEEDWKRTQKANWIAAQTEEWQTIHKAGCKEAEEMAWDEGWKTGWDLSETKCRLSQETNKLSLDQPVTHEGNATIIPYADRNILRHAFSHLGSYDVVFKVNEATFPAHTLILGGASDWFTDLIQDHFKKTTDQEISVSNVKNTQSFATILEYIYGFDFVVSNYPIPVIAEMLHLAGKFGLLKLQEILSCYLNKFEQFHVISMDDAVTLINTAHKEMLSKLNERVNHYLNQNAEEFLRHKAFLRLKPGVLANLVTSHHFFAREIDILQAVLKWIEVNVEGSDQNQEQSSSLSFMASSQMELQDEDVNESNKIMALDRAKERSSGENNQGTEGPTDIENNEIVRDTNTEILDKFEFIQVNEKGESEVVNGTTKKLDNVYDEVNTAEKDEDTNIENDNTVERVVDTKEVEEECKKTNMADEFEVIKGSLEETINIQDEIDSHDMDAKIDAKIKEIVEENMSSEIKIEKIRKKTSEGELDSSSDLVKLKNENKMRFSYTLLRNIRFHYVSIQDYFQLSEANQRQDLIQKVLSKSLRKEKPRVAKCEKYIVLEIGQVYVRKEYHEVSQPVAIGNGHECCVEVQQEADKKHLEISVIVTEKLLERKVKPEKYLCSPCIYPRRRQHATKCAVLGYSVTLKARSSFQNDYFIYRDNLMEKYFGDIETESESEEKEDEDDYIEEEEDPEDPEYIQPEETEDESPPEDPAIIDWQVKDSDCSSSSDSDLGTINGSELNSVYKHPQKGKRLDKNYTLDHDILFGSGQFISPQLSYTLEVYVQYYCSCGQSVTQ